MRNTLPIFIILAALIAVATYFILGRPTTLAPTQPTETVTPEQTHTGAVDVVSARRDIVGTWQSEIDPQAVVRFNEDGTAQDLYSDEELGTGTWNINTDAVGDAEHATVLTSRINKEEYQYVIWTLNDTELVLNYVASGSTLPYTRVSE